MSSRFSNIKETDQYKQKSRERSKSSQSSNKPLGKCPFEQYSFEIFIEQYTYDQLQENNKEFLQKLLTKYSYEISNIDKSYLKGAMLKFIDKSMIKKTDWLEEILEECSRQSNSRSKKSEIICFIPECMVSLVIGAQGHQVKSIMENSGATIVVNQPMEGFQNRSVKISGKIIAIIKAFQIIYNFVDEKLPQVDLEAKGKESLLPISNHQIQARLVFKEDLVGFVIGEHGSNVKKLCSKFSVAIKFYKDKYIYCVKRSEMICRISGRLDNVQQTILEILKKVNEYYDKENITDDIPVKILMPAKYVTKLIGTGGSLIKEIASKAGGAIIKIQSKKGNSYDPDNIVKVFGELPLQQDASCIIIEYLEIFASGITNSVPEIVFKIRKSKSRSYSKSEKQSRSRSKSKPIRKRKSSSFSKKFKYQKISSSNSRQYSSSRSKSVKRNEYSRSISHSRSKRRRRDHSPSKSYSRYSEESKRGKKKKIHHKNSRKQSFEENKQNNKLKKTKKEESASLQDNIKKQHLPSTEITQKQPANFSTPLEFEISKDFAFKAYGSSNVIQLSLLIQSEFKKQLQILLQNTIRGRFNTKAEIDDIKIFKFANNEQECFILKILGQPNNVTQCMNFIMEQIIECSKEQSKK